MDTLVGLYGIVLGVFVVGWWAVAYARDRIPEMRSERWAIRLHLLAEAMMALTVIAGGIMVLGAVETGPAVLLVGFGMVLYSLVAGSGYFIQRRQRPPVVAFGILFVVTVLAASWIVLSPGG
jgi:hypothetical protein